MTGRELVEKKIGLDGPLEPAWADPYFRQENSEVEGPDAMEAVPPLGKKGPGQILWEPQLEEHSAG
jgi:hypothetical protein